MKTMWVTIFKCFHCGKRGHDLIKCLQCQAAYYCDRQCLGAHATAHAKVCIATVAAKAQRAHRERLARAVRENGKDDLEGGGAADIPYEREAAVIHIGVWSRRTHEQIDTEGETMQQMSRCSHIKIII